MGSARAATNPWTAKPVGRLGIVVRRMAGAMAVREALARGLTVRDAGPAAGRMFPSLSYRAQMEAVRLSDPNCAPDVRAAAAERHDVGVETLREELGFLVRDFGFELRVAKRDPGDPTIVLCNSGRTRLFVAVSFGNVAASLTPADQKLDPATGLDLDFLLLAHGRASTAQLAGDAPDVVRTNIRHVALAAAESLSAELGGSRGEEYQRALKLQARAEPLAVRVPRQLDEAFGWLCDERGFACAGAAAADDETASARYASASGDVLVQVNWDVGKVAVSTEAAEPQIRDLPRIDAESLAATVRASAAQLRSSL